MYSALNGRSISIGTEIRFTNVRSPFSLIRMRHELCLSPSLQPAETIESHARCKDTFVMSEFVASSVFLAQGPCAVQQSNASTLILNPNLEPGSAEWCQCS